MSDYQKLVGEGTSGDFVAQTQGVASDKGFGNVSKAWYPKTKSYDEGLVGVILVNYLTRQ